MNQRPFSNSQSSKASASAAEQFQNAHAQHWDFILQNIGRPLMASLVVDLFNEEPDFRRDYPGVYLYAMHTIRANEMRQARSARVKSTLLKAALNAWRHVRGAMGSKPLEPVKQPPSGAATARQRRLSLVAKARSHRAAAAQDGPKRDAYPAQRAGLC